MASRASQPSRENGRAYFSVFVTLLTIMSYRTTVLILQWHFQITRLGGLTLLAKSVLHIIMGFGQCCYIHIVNSLLKAILSKYLVSQAIPHAI